MNDKRQRRRKRGNVGASLVVAPIASIFGALAMLGLLALLAQAWPDRVVNLWDSQMRFPTPNGVLAVLVAAGAAACLLTDPIVQWLSGRRQ